MSKKVSVKILKYVGAHKPGEVVQVDPDTAAHLCRKVMKNDGHGLKEYQHAMLLEDYEKVQEDQKLPANVAKMSQHEFNQLGLKNVVQTPSDPAFETQLEAKRKMDAAWLEKKQAEEAAAAEKARLAHEAELDAELAAGEGDDEDGNPTDGDGLDESDDSVDDDAPVEGAPAKPKKKKAKKS